MAGKGLSSVVMSLDGFIAPESLGDLMGQQWMELQQWLFPQRFLRENLKLREGGEEARGQDIVRETIERTAAGPALAGPEDGPFSTLVFGVTQETGDPGEPRGATRFHVFSDGIPRP